VTCFIIIESPDIFRFFLTDEQVSPHGECDLSQSENDIVAE